MKDKLRQENETLKQRIRAGAFEYVSLNKKYIKLKRAFDNKVLLDLNEIKIEKQPNNPIQVMSTLN